MAFFQGAGCSDGHWMLSDIPDASQACGQLVPIPFGRTLCRTVPRTLPCPQTQPKAVTLFAPPLTSQVDTERPKRMAKTCCVPFVGPGGAWSWGSWAGLRETLCAGIGAGNPGVVGRSRKGSSKGFLLGLLSWVFYATLPESGL